MDEGRFLYFFRQKGANGMLDINWIKDNQEMVRNTAKWKSDRLYK